MGEGWAPSGAYGATRGNSNSLELTASYPLKGAPAAMRRAASQPRETNSRRHLCMRQSPFPAVLPPGIGGSADDLRVNVPLLRYGPIGRLKGYVGTPDTPFMGYDAALGRRAI